MGKIGTGVEVREKSLRVQFQWQGRTVRETVYRAGKPLPPTPANIKYAERMTADIRAKISLGSFTFREYFPHSTRAELDAGSGITFGALCDQWLKTKGRLSSATLYQYRGALEFWKSMLGEDTVFDTISHGKVASIVGGHPWASAKLCNNYLIPLRGVFTLGARELKVEDPLEGVENSKVQKTAPDPIPPKEMKSILDRLARDYDEQVVNYFEFAFVTGMRPEEIVALEWPDIDWGLSTALVERSKSFRGEISTLKTYQIRNVDLVKRALAVLERQKKWTMSGGKEIFHNPVTGKAWNDGRAQRVTYWDPTLKALGLRRRRPYQTRHTYATNALRAGVNPSYVSRQMGHRSAKMLFEVYSKWIDAADRGREKEKMETLIPV